MYSNVESVQFLVAGLKAYCIHSVVVSAGTSHDAIVRSLEEDPYFTTYSVVDERSAAFFACGISQELGCPVAICCTAGTAAINYLSGLTEASKRNLPIVAITADKNPYYLNQNEDQMIDQPSVFKPIVKYSCRLPIIKNNQDKWYCQRIINEALLEMNHHGAGPVHIDVPIEAGMFAIDGVFTTEELPTFQKIDRYILGDATVQWEKLFETLADKKILIQCGQDINPSVKKKELIEKITKKYNCVVAVDKLSNLYGKGIVEASKATRVFFNNYEKLFPEIIISLEGSSTDYKFKLKTSRPGMTHWLVCEDGVIRDMFRKLSTVFEGTAVGFLEIMSQYGGSSDGSYYNAWKVATDQFNIPEIEYSNLYAIKEMMKRIPAKANLNIGNSSPIRVSQYFDLDQDVKVFCNRGVNGIDGCVSTFIGQAAVSPEKLNYLIVGDLSFFYDMDSLWNRYIGKNVRIMMSNNGGAALFHFNQGLQKYPTLNENVAAEHFASAKGWVESQGFIYMSAHNKEEFDEAIDTFMVSETEKPLFFEVFTKKEVDAEIQHKFFDKITLPAPEHESSEEQSVKKNSIGKRTKEAVKVFLGEELVNKIRNRKP